MLVFFKAPTYLEDGKLGPFDLFSDNMTLKELTLIFEGRKLLCWDWAVADDSLHAPGLFPNWLPRSPPL